MRAYIVFSGTGPILVLTTYPELADPRLVEKLSHKGIVLHAHVMDQTIDLIVENLHLEIQAVEILRSGVDNPGADGDFFTGSDHDHVACDDFFNWDILFPAVSDDTGGPGLEPHELFDFFDGGQV